MANSYQSTRPRSGFRQRRKSGDDVCLPMSGNNPEQPSSTESTNRFGVFLDSFRPRSKSDANKSMRRSNIISSMKSGVHRSLTGSAIILDSETAVSLPTSPHAMDASDNPAAGIRLRSGSESSKTAVRSVMDRIRGRPAAATELEKRKFSKSNSSISSASVSASLYRRHDEPFRRRSLSGSDAANDHNRMAFIFRDSRGLPVVDPFIDTLNSNEIKEDEAQIYVRFFKFHKCYDLIPTSAKLVVFDTLLRVKKAFFALVYNGVRAAPLWDSNQQRFVGMLTITDFIHILKAYYRKPNEKMEELEEHKLDTWRTVLASRSKPLISISPEEPLFTAISTLLVNKIHRLPVIDPVSGDVLYIITHKRILRFLHLYLDELPRPSFLENTLEELKLGTYDSIETATFDTPVIDALTKFVSRRISALPIVDQDGKLVHIYAKFDVINLAAERIYDQLHLPLKDVISHRSENVVEYCQITHTLSQVIDQLVRAEVHRLVVTDAERRVIGVVSLSDILEAMIIRPQDYARTCRDTSTEGFSAGDIATHTGLLVTSDDVILQASHRTIPEEDGTEDEQTSSATDALADESEE